MSCSISILFEAVECPDCGASTSVTAMASDSKGGFYLYCNNCKKIIRVVPNVSE